MTDGDRTTDDSTRRAPWRDRTLILWAGVAGYLMLALAAPIGPRGWTGGTALVLACVVAFFALQHQRRARTRVRPRDLPWVLGGGLLVLAVVRGVGWALGAAS